MVLVPQVRAAVSLPLLAAGGIVSGAGMAAAFALGAEGVQVGTRFALCRESSASEEFKQLCLGLKEGDTMLALKKVSPTRLIKNDFYSQVQEAEDRGASKEELVDLLGRGRARQGIFEGDLSARRPVSRRAGDRPGSLPHLRPALGSRYSPLNGGRLPSGRGRDGGAVICFIYSNGIELREMLRKSRAPVLSEVRLVVLSFSPQAI